MAPQSPKKNRAEVVVAEEGQEIVLVEKEDDPDEATLLAAATCKKEEGNAHFANQHFGEAAVSYREALEILGGHPAQDLLVSLHSNLALVAIKAKNFQEAEHHCTLAVEWDDRVAKIWYRRGTAREHLQKLEPALEDYKYSVRLLQAQKQNDLIKTALQAMQRVDQQLKKQQKEEAAAASNNNQSQKKTAAPAPATTLNGTHITTASRPPPSPADQKSVAMKLLCARSVALQSRPSTPSEALLLMDWNWWCQWCRHVQLFSANPQRVLNVLIAGAIAPPEKDDDDDDSSTDSEDQDDPGPIDNSALLLPTDRFHQQWYQHFSADALKPNLVRGFHYEILPREVYAALSQWYGEITPRILRRTREGTEVDLYPNMNDPKTAKPQQQCAACRARAATKRCTRCMAVWYCDRTCQNAHWSHHKPACSKMAQQLKTGQPPVHTAGGGGGRVGLNNLGNTCFMASALQCLSHATPLTRHFLSDQYVVDLNPNNPLGTGGKLAHAFDHVLKDMWWRTNQSSTSPTALKRAIALFAPRFAGCLQHDAQEFLAYLLDGLHEDLNRIKQAPYVEMPDFDNNGAATQVNASLAWDCHLRRNDSLILDTFYGQFKSTCVCPCGRISVSFDAFNHVSLEIPQLQQSTVWLSFLVFGRSESSPSAAVKYGMGLRRGSLVFDVRETLSKSFGIPSSHIVICEISDHSIVELLREDKPISTISPNDTIGVYMVEPYTTSSIHIIASHALAEEDRNGQMNRDLFGLPFLTSCDANLTCRQLFDHIWGSVRHMVVPVTEDGNLDDDLYPELEEVYKQLVDIRVIDTEGTAMLVFPSGEPLESSNPQEEEKNEEEIPQPPLTPYLPRDNEEQIQIFLGEDCTTRFLFLSLEWTVNMDVPGELLQKYAPLNNTGSSNNKKKKKMKKNIANKAAKIIPKTVSIFAKRFNFFTEHPAYHECLRKKREMDAARGVSLDQCFETFTKPERLDEHNMWYCSNCKEHVRALKTMELWRLPNILMVHLKRFEFRHGYRRDKLATFVDFPMEGLDMSRHCAQWKDDGNPPEQLHINDRIPAIYDLFAVVNHYGRMGFGHYTAFARKWDEEELSSDWALFDDSSVRSVGNGRGGTGGVVDDVVSPAAYVLFYRRRTFN